MSLLGYMAAGAAAGAGKGIADTALLQMKARVEKNKAEYLAKMQDKRLTKTIEANKDSASILASAKIATEDKSIGAAKNAAKLLAGGKDKFELKSVTVEDKNGDESVQWVRFNKKTGEMSPLGANETPPTAAPTGGADHSALWSGGSKTPTEPSATVAGSPTPKPSANNKPGLMKNAGDVLSSIKDVPAVADTSKSDAAKTDYDNYLRNRASKLPVKSDPQVTRLKHAYEKALATEQRQAQQTQESNAAKNARFNSSPQDYSTL